MADPLSIGGGIVSVIGLAIQISQVVVQFGLDWKYAPADVKMFMTELQALKTTLSETHTNLILNPDFAEAFQTRPSLLLSQLDSSAPSTTDAKLMLQVCQRQLKSLLEDLKEKGKGRRFGWDRLKRAFTAKNTRESVENLHRSCEALNRMLSIDVAALGATTYKEVKDTRKEQQDARREQQDARKEQQDATKEQQKWHQDEKMQELLNWLAWADHGSQQTDFLARRQEGTGQWLLDSSEFRTWCNSPSSTLFCPGMPGAGKTILTSIVIDYLCTKYRDDNDVGTAYLYCNFRRTDEQKPAALLASLLRQLLQGSTVMSASVKRLYEKHSKEQTRPSLQEICSELHTVIANYSKCYIIVDALDECSTSEGRRQTLLTELFGLRAMGGVNLFATSRFIPQIQQEFRNSSITLEIRASDDDVRRYLDDQMKRLPSYVLRNADLREEIQAEIVNAVQGMFLLAQLHLDSLVDMKSVKALRTALKKLPKGSVAYDQAYKDAMDRIRGQNSSSQELALQTLSWITCAKRPLTTSELQHALAVEVDECELDEENLSHIEDVVSVCAGLVSIDQESDIIRLVHYTTQEFFERTQGDWFPDAQEEIATTCISYLSFDVFGSGSCLSDEDFEARLRREILLDYASKNWAHHALGTSAELAESTLHLLENDLMVSACTQVIMASEYHYPGYSQTVNNFTGPHLAAYFGLSQTLVWLLKRGNQPDLRDSVGQTPLSWAAEKGHEAVVKLLVNRDDVEADSRDNHGHTPLSRAAESGHEAVVKLLVNRDDVEADSKDDEFGQTPLSWAAESGHEAVVKLLVNRDDVEAESRDNHGQTPLSWAAVEGHEAVVKLLVSRDDVEADSRDNHGQTPLSWAAAKGHEAIVKLLLSRDDVKADAKGDHHGQTPLSRAAAEGREAVVKLLVNRDDVEIDSKSKADRTPLSYAAKAEDEVIVKLLVERGAEIDSKDHEGRTPLSYAVEYGRGAVVQLLLERGAEIDSKDEGGRTPLSWGAVKRRGWEPQAVKEGRQAVIQLLLAKGADTSVLRDCDDKAKPLQPM